MIASALTLSRSLGRRGAGLLLACLALLALLGVLPLAHAQSAGAVLPVPALTGQVIDDSGTLSGPDRQALTQQLAQVEQTLGTQMVILMVPSTQPEDIAAYANRVADAWKIGRKTVGDGLLVVVAVQDRRMRIEVARTLEGAVPDLAAYRIIEETLKPAFRQGQYAQGLGQAVTQLTGLIKGEALPPPAPHAAAGDDSFDPTSLGVFLLIAVPVVGGMINNILGRKLGSAVIAVGTAGLVWFFTASLIFAALAGVLAVVLAAAIGGGGGGRGGGLGGGPVIFPGGGSGRSGGGGGFSSGGGGSFGGGGASGGW